MPDYKKDYRSGRGRDFNSRGSSPRPQMHKAVCTTCGNACEVPFFPTGNKPVYCSNCFEKNGGRDAGRSNDRPMRRPSFEERPLFDAICDNCGNSCKIPFQPRTGKPVYCSNCFESVVGANPRSEQRNTSSPKNNEQFAELNAKLDKILSLLSPDKPVETVLTPQMATVAQEETQEVIEKLPEPITDTPKKRSRAVKKVTPSAVE